MTQKQKQAIPAAKAKAFSAFESLVAKTGAQEITNDRDPVKLEIGDYVIARLVGVRDVTIKATETEPAKDAVAYDLDGREGERLFMLGRGNLNQKLESGALVGHVIGIAAVGEVDIGKQSPMRDYKVVDFGADFPPAIK